MTFYLPQKEKDLFCVLKVKVVHVCLQYTFSLPNAGNYLFLGLSKCFPKFNFYLPWAIRQVLMWVVTPCPCQEKFYYRTMTTAVSKLSEDNKQIKGLNFKGRLAQLMLAIIVKKSFFPLSSD